MKRFSKPSIVFWCPLAYVFAVAMAFRAFCEGAWEEAKDAWDDLGADFQTITRNTGRMWRGESETPAK